jgi:DNA-binding NarL/FixJ family response regulator
MPRIRVLIADDHAILRAGLRMLVNAQPDMEAVGQAANVVELLREAPQVNPDVVVLDVAMPGGSGISAIGRLRQECPEARVVVLTAHDDPTYLHSSLAAGACGFVVKAAADTELVAAIRAVYAGRTFVDLGARLAQGPPPGAEAAAHGAKGTADLSRRECEVLRLLSHGHTNQQVADRLFLSVKTVETYRSRIGQKLGLHSRADIVRFALEIGWLGPDPADPCPSTSLRGGLTGAPAAGP